MDQVDLSLFVDGENFFLQIPAGTTVENIHKYTTALLGKPISGYRVGGKPALPGQVLAAGQRVTSVPIAGVVG